MFCPKCGNQIADGLKFCPTCGSPAPMVSQPAAAQAQPQQQVYQAQQPIQQQAYQQPYQAQQPTQQQAYQQQPYQQPAYQQQPYQAQQPAYQQQPYQQPKQQPYQAPKQQAYAGAPSAGQYAGAAATTASRGISSGVIIGIIAAIVVVAAIVVFVVVKPFDAFGATPKEAFEKTYNSITSSGSFHESIDIDLDMDVVGTKVGMGINMDVAVSGYDPNNLSNTTMDGTGTFDLSSLGYGTIPFKVYYANGMMTLDMGSYGSQTQAMDLDSLISTDANYDDLWQYATMNGNTITFDLSNVNLNDLMSNGLLDSTGSDLSSLDDYTFDTMTYTVTLDDAAGKINADLVLAGSYNQYGASGKVNMTMKYVIYR